MSANPIIIVEDDTDDCEMLIETFREIGVMNEFRCFDNPIPALEYLRTTVETPFIIISDLNMPRMNGLTFKRAINEDVEITRRKIPFVIFSTASETTFVDSAYNLAVQGYFKKPADLSALKEIASAIILYWRKSCFTTKTDLD